MLKKICQRCYSFKYPCTCKCKSECFCKRLLESRCWSSHVNAQELLVRRWKAKQKQMKKKENRKKKKKNSEQMNTKKGREIKPAMNFESEVKSVFQFWTVLLSWNLKHLPLQWRMFYCNVSLTFHSDDAMRVYYVIKGIKIEIIKVKVKGSWKDRKCQGTTK